MVGNNWVTQNFIIPSVNQRQSRYLDGHSQRSLHFRKKNAWQSKVMARFGFRLCEHWSQLAFVWLASCFSFHLHKSQILFLRFATHFSFHSGSQIGHISCVSPFKEIWAPFLRNPLETSPESYRFQKQVHSTLIEGANSLTVWYNYSCFAFLVHVFSRIIARFRYLGALPYTRWVTNSVHTNAKEFAFMGDELAVVQHDSAISKHDSV